MFQYVSISFNMFQYVLTRPFDRQRRIQ